jgi:hypothetical protein
MRVGLGDEGGTEQLLHRVRLEEGRLLLLCARHLLALLGARLFCGLPRICPALLGAALVALALGCLCLLVLADVLDVCVHAGLDALVLALSDGQGNGLGGGEGPHRSDARSLHAERILLKLARNDVSNSLEALSKALSESALPLAEARRPEAILLDFNDGAAIAKLHIGRGAVGNGRRKAVDLLDNRGGFSHDGACL